MPHFPKTARLRYSSEFDSVFNRGVKVVLPSVVLIAAPFHELLGQSPGEGSARGRQSVLPSHCRIRLGIVASRRVGGAVVRNRCKRVLRSAFANVLGQLEGLLPLKCHQEHLRHIDIIVIVRSALQLSNSRDMEKRFLEHFPRLCSKLVKIPARIDINPGTAG